MLLESSPVKHAVGPASHDLRSRMACVLGRLLLGVCGLTLRLCSSSKYEDGQDEVRAEPLLGLVQAQQQQPRQHRSGDLEAQESSEPADLAEQSYVDPSLKIDEQRHTRMLKDLADIKEVLQGSKVCLHMNGQNVCCVRPAFTKHLLRVGRPDMLASVSLSSGPDSTHPCSLGVTLTALCSCQASSCLICLR